MLEEFARCQHARARGDELDGERQAVDAPGDLVRSADVLVVPHDVGPYRLDTLHEELGSITERGDGVLVLALQPQGLTARREHFQVAGGLEQQRDQRSTGEKVLEVVEHEEEALLTEAVRKSRRLVRAERRAARKRQRSPPARGQGR